MVLIVLAVANFFVLFALLRMDQTYEKDPLSPGCVFVYFSLLQATTMLSYALQIDQLRSCVFSLVDPRYAKQNLVIRAYIYTLIGMKMDCILAFI